MSTIVDPALRDPCVYFYVSRMRGGSLFAVPIRVLRTDEHGWSQVRGLAGGARWKRAFSVHRHEIYTTVPTSARLVPGSRAVLDAAIPKEVLAARALRKRLVRKSQDQDSDWSPRETRRAFSDIESIAEAIYAKNPSDIAWRFYADERAEWLSRADEHADWLPQHLPLLFQMIDNVLGAAERIGPCAAHTDCAEHPELGEACKATRPRRVVWED